MGKQSQETSKRLKLKKIGKSRQTKDTKQKSRNILNIIQQQEQNIQVNNTDSTTINELMGPTQTQIEDIIHKIKQNSNSKQLVRFAKLLKRVICDEEESTSEIERTDNQMYRKVLLFSLKDLPECFSATLKIKIKHDLNSNNASHFQQEIQQQQISLCLNHKRDHLLLRSFLTSLFKLLQKISAQEDMLGFVLTHFENWMPLLPLVSDLSIYKKIVLFLINEWAVANELNVKLRSFMCLRALVGNILKKEIKIVNGEQQQKLALLDFIFKKMYITFIQNSKVVKWRNFDLIQFQINCLVELYELDLDTTYFIMFHFVRQLAMHLKTAFRDPSRLLTTAVQKDKAIQKSKAKNDKKNDTPTDIFNWQYLNSLRVWAELTNKIARHTQVLAPLQFPLIQVLCGSLSLQFHPCHFPFFIHIIKLLLKVKGEQTIPAISTTIVKMLSNVQFTKNRKKKNKKTPNDQFDHSHQKAAHFKPVDLYITLKTKEAQQNQNAYWNNLFNELCDLLIQSQLPQKYMTSMGELLGWPETTYNLVNALKGIRKAVEFRFYKSKLTEIVRLLEADAQLVREFRVRNIISSPSQLFDNENIGIQDVDNSLIFKGVDKKQFKALVNSLQLISKSEILNKAFEDTFRTRIMAEKDREERVQLKNDQIEAEEDSNEQLEEGEDELELIDKNIGMLEGDPSDDAEYASEGSTDLDEGIQQEKDTQNE